MSRPVTHYSPSGSPLPPAPHNCNPLGCPICSRLDVEVQIADLCRQRALLRRTLYEYMRHNQVIVTRGAAYWHPRDHGAQAPLPRPASIDEVALLDSLREEYGG